MMEIKQLNIFVDQIKGSELKDGDILCVYGEHDFNQVKALQESIKHHTGLSLVIMSLSKDDKVSVLQKTLQKPVLKFKRLRDNGLNPPVYATDGAAGMDVQFDATGHYNSYFEPMSADRSNGITIAPGERKLFKTGFSVEIPPGYEIQVRSRSGHAFKFGVAVLNSPGTIDSDYRGEIGVILINHGSETVKFVHGDRIAQLVLAKVERLDIVETTTELSDTERGAGGFGSTGVNG